MNNNSIVEFCQIFPLVCTGYEYDNKVILPFIATIQYNCLIEGLERIKRAVSGFHEVTIFDGITGFSYPWKDSNRIHIYPKYNYQSKRPEIIILGPYYCSEHALVNLHNFTIERVSHSDCESLKIFFKNGTFFFLKYTSFGCDPIRSKD